MTELVIYNYDAAGHINSTSHGHYYADKDSAYLTAPNKLLATQLFPAVLTVNNSDGSVSTFNTQVTGGWSFVLDGNGIPALDADGNHLVMPPPINIPNPAQADYVFAALVADGKIDITKVDADTINRTNLILAKAGLSPLAGTKALPAPTTSAVTTSAPYVAPLPVDNVPAVGVTVADIAAQVTQLAAQVSNVSNQMTAVSGQVSGIATATVATAATG